MTDSNPTLDADPQEKQRRAEEVFEASIEHISEEEIETAAATGQEKIDRLAEKIPKALAEVWHDTKTLVAMTRDYAARRYRDVPFGTIAAAAGAVLYFVSPYDVIPDFFLALGYVDDAAVLGLCLKMVRGDLQRYRENRTLAIDHVEIVED